MITVYFSHVGEAPLVGVDEPETVRPGKIRDILRELEARHPGFCKEILDGNGTKFNSATLIFKCIEADSEGRLLETEHTKPIKGLNEEVYEQDENILIALFHPEQLVKFLLETLTPTEDHFELTNRPYRAFISAPTEQQGSQKLFLETTPEPLYPFTNGRSISELETDALIYVRKSKLIPTALRDAIATLWEIEGDFRLRLFQEEALVHILDELAKADDAAKQPLLLSIPTGGGKTEAFLIPLIAHLYDQRTRLLQSGFIPQAVVRAIVTYPTRALANDQARRIAEILYQMNEGAIEDRKISVGVLTGDTPDSGFNLLTEKSLLQLCPRCSSVLTNFLEREAQDKQGKIMVARCICGAEIDYFRLTRNDILNYPPDILITSPDMINRMLQLPRYHKRIFTTAIDMVVFDEIHMYSSVFGCNVAHLLRRFEEACKRKPLYVGVSATIRNAKELACLIFDADLEYVKYLRPAGENEAVTAEKRPYLDYQSEPARYRYHYALTPARLPSGRIQKMTTSVLNVADVLAHLLRDPHFRKTLIFSNLRQDTDDIVRFLKDQEDRYYSTYRHHLLPRVLSMRASQNKQAFPFTDIETDVICAIDRWYQKARASGMLYDSSLEVGWHRGGLERDERIKAVNRFSSMQRLNVPDEDNSEMPIDVMVATSTLELGIDIGDVTTVMNCGAPFTTNEYTQRVGRGGRRKDAMALTVIDPRNPLDFYFLKHFHQYAHPRPDDFEDAPIIVSNLEVMKSHIYARLLDWLARSLDENSKGEMKAGDLQEAKVVADGQQVMFRDNWQVFARTLFTEIFTPEVVARLQIWMRREAQLIPGIRETEITIEELQSWWEAKCMQLNGRMSSGQKDIQETDDLSGMETKDRELVPDLRSSGPSVGLYLVREGSEDELRDTVSRRQAIQSRPVGGYASQGSITFKIEAIKDQDHDTEEKIKRLLIEDVEGAKATEYFSKMFGDDANHSPFPVRPLDAILKVNFETPKDLSVKYNPYRFYCPRCGATYSDKKAGDERCVYCHSMLRQLTELYMCGGCGELYLPPVPKVCVNPGCIEQAKSRKTQTPFLPDGYKRVGKGDHHNEYFRFSALPMLHWQCRSCGTEINYHAHYELPQHIQKQLEGATWSRETPAGAAKAFLHQPESPWRNSYARDGFHEARFTCHKCRAKNQYKKISVKNIPSFRSVVHEYLFQKEEIAPELSTSIGKLHFKRVSIITLAREHFRRFYSAKTHEMSVDLKPIFSDTNSYLANTYDTHAAYFRFSDILDRFLNTDTSSFTCSLDPQCPCRREQTGQVLVDIDDQEEVDVTKPVLAKLSWERGRKPDPRRKWCAVVQGNVAGKVCPGEEALCDVCPHFDRRRHLRYLVLHTLEHAIITAMPKYTGINKNQVRGTLYPNDEQDYDLVLVDTIEGGSGSMYLLRKNWDQVWQIVGELLEAAQDERGQLALPYTCSRYNRDLCPHLAFAFYQFVSVEKR
jgi:ATP-dependent helicase YprA (DUF1998 family)